MVFLDKNLTFLRKFITFLLLLGIIGTINCSFQLKEPLNSKHLTFQDVKSTVIRKSVSSYIQRPRIAINNDSDFKTQNWPGNGTEEKPYIIENFYIDENGASNFHRISIQNTRSHFVISNCWLEKGDKELDYAGIYLFNTSNGHIVNNTCNDNNWGIYLNNNCTNITLDSNTCYYNTYGIYNTNNCFNNTITRNNCTYSRWNGITLNNYCKITTIISNTCINNTGNGILVSDSDNNVIKNNTCHSNENGIRLFFNANHNTVMNNTCYDNSDHGIEFFGSAYNNATSNYCANNTYNIATIGSDSAYVNNNTCRNGTYGIYFEREGSSCTAIYNDCLNNTYGIIVKEYTYNTLVLRNNIINNTYNGWDDGNESIFDYNYWSDYYGSDNDGDGIGDEPYYMSGSSNNVDLHPRIDPSTQPVAAEITDTTESSSKSTITSTGSLSEPPPVDGITGFSVIIMIVVSLVSGFVRVFSRFRKTGKV